LVFLKGKKLFSKNEGFHKWKVELERNQEAWQNGDWTNKTPTKICHSTGLM
jgi:hypothetical protein